MAMKDFGILLLILLILMAVITFLSWKHTLAIGENLSKESHLENTFNRKISPFFFGFSAMGIVVILLFIVISSTKFK